ncbi:amino acid transporter [Novacetimonas maltaceti]|uniref:Homoserine/homoserine lactone efflux protein n=1 Tax=Novacetimonas maltaceti TaxID=1203393 RepID=A0A2S3W1R1_9PROT|nr:LysE family translocator [Novacetimonas maltaceti]POF62503.1 Homoserine/homoserine lactone efflux protein [Novacetimonas maltaceti]PYD62226.1 amino acid transporter [Novacetimonas maltaceti]
MTLHSWWLFSVAVFLLCAIPGPNMLHVLTRSVHFGVRRTTATMAGCLLALLVALGASAAGLSAALAASPRLFGVLRVAGACYLVFLGIRAWRADAGDAPPQGDGEAAPDPAGTTPFALFRGGFLVAISNPKLLLFAAAFFPQFINPAAAKLPQFSILVATFATIETGWYMVYALGGRKMAAYLERPALKRAFNRVTGGIFIGFGAILLRARA